VRAREFENAMSFMMGSVDGLTSEKLVDVLTAWRQAAKGRMAPKREEITPALVKNALPWIWMIDAVDGGKDFRFRLAGDRIIQFMGRRYAGSLLSEFTDQPFFQHMHQILTACVAQKRPLMVGPGRSNMKGREYLELEVVALPLSEDGEQVTTIFGAMEIGAPRPPSAERPAGKLPEGQP
jgi:hypothetical protein